MIARHLCDIQMGLYASPEYLASIGGVDGRTIYRSSG